jgi:predicted anti-sigma-YlaC factor YlaD
MRCEPCREIISAHTDGEAAAAEWALAQDHLAGCTDCRDYLATSEQLARFTRLRAAEPVPDLTPRIIEAAGIRADGGAAAPDGSLGIRIVLALTGVLQIAVAVPALILGDDAQLPVHIARHIGSFDVALAVGFIWVALRPRQALAGVLPIAIALVACLTVSSVADVIAGRAAAYGELQHVTDLIGLTALWLLSLRMGTAGGPTRRPHLRHVAG